MAIIIIIVIIIIIIIIIIISIIIIIINIIIIIIINRITISVVLFLFFFFIFPADAGKTKTYFTWLSAIWSPDITESSGAWDLLSLWSYAIAYRSRTLNFFIRPVRRTSGDVACYGRRKVS